MQKILHVDSIGLISEPFRSATLSALEIARENHVLISCDPNLWLAVWSDSTAAKTGMLSIWDQADMIKVSEEELQFLTGSNDVGEAISALRHNKLKLMVVTLGSQGSQYFTPNFSGYIPGFQMTAVDTTGAGDGFVASLISGLLNFPQGWEVEDQLVAISRRVNAVGALTTTQLGAIPSLPTSKQLDAFMDE